MISLVSVSVRVRPYTSSRCSRHVFFLWLTRTHKYSHRVLASVILGLLEQLGESVRTKDHTTQLSRPHEYPRLLSIHIYLGLLVLSMLPIFAIL